MNQEQIKAKIESAKGQFCAVEFIKKDGTVRKMTIQPATLKFKVKGDAASDKAKRATATRKANNPHLLAVWDVKAQGVRSINLDTLTRLSVGGKTWEF